MGNDDPQASLNGHSGELCVRFKAGNGGGEPDRPLVTEVVAVEPILSIEPGCAPPGKAVLKGYALLHRALSETGKAGIAKVAIHNREYLSCVKPDGLFFILDLMHFAEEVLEPEGLKVVAGADRGFLPRARSSF